MLSDRFLVSRYLALVEVSHRVWSYQPCQLIWWIVMINLLGSIAFMAAALFGYFVPSSGNAEWSRGANFYTLLALLGLCISASSSAGAADLVSASAFSKW